MALEFERELEQQMKATGFAKLENHRKINWTEFAKLESNWIRKARKPQENQLDWIRKARRRLEKFSNSKRRNKSQSVQQRTQSVTTLPPPWLQYCSNITVPMVPMMLYFRIQAAPSPLLLSKNSAIGLISLKRSP